MSILLTSIKADLQDAMKAEIQCRRVGDSPPQEVLARKDVPRAIISMFPELGKKPGDATDEDVIKLLKKFIGNEKTRQLYIDKHLTAEDVESLTASELSKLISKKIVELGDSLTSERIKVAEGYLPKAASKDEIISWIKENIDFSQYKNKMQAMGPIMKRFKSNDGNFVKEILMEL